MKRDRYAEIMHTLLHKI